MKPNFTFSFFLVLLILLLSLPISSFAQRDNLNERAPKRNPPDDRVKRIDNEEKKDRDRYKEREPDPVVKEREHYPIFKERTPEPPVNEIIVEQPVIIIEKKDYFDGPPHHHYIPRPSINPIPEKPNYKLDGIEKYEQEDYWGALSLFNIAVEETPDDSDLYFHRGMVEMKIKFFEEAKEDFDIFLEYKFYEPEAYFQRGLAKFYLNERDDALKDLRIAADIGDKRAALIIKRYYN
jgi:tetratricopeptide (TPR) repeat protein